MPAEAARFYRRLARRDWWFIALIVIATVVVTAGSIVFSEGNGGRRAQKGCFSLERASIMGAATTTYCGADAARFCRKAPAGDGEIASKCDALGLKRPETS
ncbi:MAG: hypothetical protein QOJ47_841 [Gaiellales bacterium]|nr:hypothetical protein [Gaiellales bacterium]